MSEEQNTPTAPEGATPAERQQATKLEAAAQRCWNAATSMDPRVNVLVNAAMGGKLSFAQLAEGMWCLGFISGYGGAMGAIAQAGPPAPCAEPDCVDGSIHEDGEVSLCWSCGEDRS